jgi:hypothetical protein
MMCQIVCWIILPTLHRKWRKIHSCIDGDSVRLCSLLFSCFRKSFTRKGLLITKFKSEASPL